MNKILVVDDEPFNVEVLKGLLSKNYDVVSAANGKEAFKKVNDISPDLILLDVIMPEIDGYEVCRQLKSDEKTRNIPIVMVTCLTDRDDRIKAIEAGADDFLNKPIDWIELSARVKSLLRIKQYLEDLEKSKNRYIKLYDFAPVGYFTFTHDGLIREVNLTGCVLLGHGRQELMNRKFSSFVAPEDIELLDRHISSALNNLDEQSCELTIKREDGSTLFVRLNSIRMETGEGIPVILTAITDITQRKKADELKTQFLSVISHELRTPITPMNAQLQMMLAGYFGELTEKQKDSLKMIQRNTIRLDGLIDDVLDISKLEAGVMKFNMVPADINEIVEHAVETMKIEAMNKNLKLALKEDKAPQVKLDKDRITQVMMDLLNNAIKFTDAGGEIKVELSCDTENVTVKVKDSGIGIRKEDIDRLFKPFQQLDPGLGRKYEGTGLGLAICKKIIMNHGGKIWIESEFGKGTAFIFSIPSIHEIKEEKVESIILEDIK